MSTSFEFPTVTPNDHGDVAVAIETARALWRRGDPQESLRWLRRAAETAEAEGDDMRALSLARAAAELKDEFRPSALPPPVARASAPPAARASAPPARPSAPPAARASAPPASGTASAIPPAPKLEPWTPPASRPPEVAAAPAAVTRAVAPTPAVPPPLPSTPRAEPTTPVAPALIPARSEATRQSSTSDARPALRVSVETLSKSSGTLVVRLLGEGDEAPPGAHEALLVPISAGVDLRNL